MATIKPHPDAGSAAGRFFGITELVEATLMCDVVSPKQIVELEDSSDYIRSLVSSSRDLRCKVCREQIVPGSNVNPNDITITKFAPNDIFIPMNMDLEPFADGMQKVHFGHPSYPHVRFEMHWATNKHIATGVFHTVLCVRIIMGGAPGAQVSAPKHIDTFPIDTKVGIIVVLCREYRRKDYTTELWAPGGKTTLDIIRSANGWNNGRWTRRWGDYVKGMYIGYDLSEKLIVRAHRLAGGAWAESRVEAGHFYGLDEEWLRDKLDNFEEART